MTETIRNGINYVEAEDVEASLRKSHRPTRHAREDAGAPLPKCACWDCQHGLDCAIELDIITALPSSVRTFATGATRDQDETKLDFDGFLSPLAIQAFGRYMHRHRQQSDGQLRDSDNWQKGIPREVFRKSAFRHFLEWWELHRAGADTTEQACALLFNIMGDLHESLKQDTAS